jgi:hypothetical protein
MSTLNDEELNKALRKAVDRGDLIDICVGIRPRLDSDWREQSGKLVAPPRPPKGTTVPGGYRDQEQEYVSYDLTKQNAVYIVQKYVMVRMTMKPEVTDI